MSNATSSSTTSSESNNYPLYPNQQLIHTFRENRNYEDAYSSSDSSSSSSSSFSESSNFANEDVGRGIIIEDISDSPAVQQEGGVGINMNDTHLNLISSFHDSKSLLDQSNSDSDLSEEEQSIVTEGENGTLMSSENERQLLLLMLLAQVCSVHDASPKTFTVHVLSLMERGILDVESVRFLFDLGLVPPLDNFSSDALLRGIGTVSSDRRLLTDKELNYDTKQEASNDEAKDMIHLSKLKQQRERSAREVATAIRHHIENHQEFPRSQNGASSWKVEHHPLSLSRYNREFTQIRLLSTGAFGQVFQSTNKLDEKDYAVKKVTFSSVGFDNDAIRTVVREVQCLAQCDHVNCVRYYTSWFEPSWMTGSGVAVGAVNEKKLLTDMQQLLITQGNENEDDSTGGSLSFCKDRKRAAAYHNTIDSVSTEGYVNSFSDDDCSEWSQENESTRFSYKKESLPQTGKNAENHHYDSEKQPKRTQQQYFWDESSSAADPFHHTFPKGKLQQQQQQKSLYKYQICLFIQMELCHPTTLADWIHHRNSQTCITAIEEDCLHQRATSALNIFHQIVCGLNHVHFKGIVHRDLKPANILLAKDGVFKIGDFGLSKLLQRVGGTFDAKQQEHSPRWKQGVGMSPPKMPHNLPSYEDDNHHTMGIGTASYASPEQISSHSYGPNADIFSLGLILLELLSNFQTEHERYKAFQDCRQMRVLPKWMTKAHPEVASFILECTEKDPSQRPNTNRILEKDLFFGSKISSEPCHEKMENLRNELKRRDDELEKHKLLLVEKDRIILDLQKKLEELSRKEDNDSGGVADCNHDSSGVQ